MNKAMQRNMIMVMALLQLGNAENTTILTHRLDADSVLVIHTVCEPICSSRACVVNKEWQVVREIACPYADAIFPEAYLTDEGELAWRDNTELLLDEEERRRSQTQTMTLTKTNP